MSAVSAAGETAAQGNVTSSLGKDVTPLVDVNPSVPIEEEEALNQGVAGESAKLSILAKAKAIEEQVI